LPRETRKLKDKWRAKTWYSVVSPPYFGGIEIGSTPAAGPSDVLGRRVETTLYDITGDFSQAHMKLYFKITGVKGVRADTILKGHEYSRDYIRSLVRRGSTPVERIVDVTTKDGYRLRLSMTAFTVTRIKASQERLIRGILGRIPQEKARNLNFDQFVQEVMLGKVASDAYNECKKIVPLRHVGIWKSKLIQVPEEKAEAVSQEKEAEATAA